MGRNRHPGTFITREAPAPEPDSELFLLGLWEFSAVHEDGSRRVLRYLCNACAAEDGVQASEESDGQYWEYAYDTDGNGDRWEKCGKCGQFLGYQIPLRCPSCGHTGCFNMRVFAWVHTGPTMSGVHGEPWIGADRDEVDDYAAQLIACQECGFEAGDRDDFLPKLAEAVNV